MREMAAQARILNARQQQNGMKDHLTEQIGGGLFIALFALDTSLPGIDAIPCISLFAILF
ncbi:hypothetical protein PAT3040_00108 [Paenibacillus agaridevorans]|uniref:Uncharacterized protein n=1 Tax=Paenibacillus agaridevorans TaxID=171404 RepID=A0A2R5EQE7_9BACL|nr:hypothetical protein PAT3040_00108 [Paenibacillus agaridevorans]